MTKKAKLNLLLEWNVLQYEIIMSVFSEISDVLLLVVHSVISVVRGNNPNGSAYNCLEIYIVCF